MDQQYTELFHVFNPLGFHKTTEVENLERYENDFLGQIYAGVALPSDNVTLQPSA